jgi:uracil-DNA glycosylase
VNDDLTSDCGIDDRPRSMRDAGVRQGRKAMLHFRHIAPLADYVAELRKRNLGEVPDFDPCDGGIDARVLFLFEKPGSMTSEAGRRVGSGFISRNNDDLTAAAIFDFMQKAAIPRKLTVIWNVVPWWNGTRKVSAQELREGTDCLKKLISLLPLRAVVMVGRKAAKAKPFLETTGLVLFTSCHPSPVARATCRDSWDAIPTEWAKVMESITAGK